MSYKYFSPSELASPDAPQSYKLMNHEFMLKLDDAREKAGIPFIINSAYRTVEHNRKVKGVTNSAHTKGLAVDIAYRNTTQAITILNALISVGFRRIGINSTFIHVDDDRTKPLPAVWGYNVTPKTTELINKYKAVISGSTPLPSAAGAGAEKAGSNGVAIALMVSSLFYLFYAKN